MTARPVVPTCLACGVARDLFPVQLMRSVVEKDGVKRSRSLPVRVCRWCLLEAARRAGRPPLILRHRGQWVHRRPTGLATCHQCGLTFQCWHARAKWCSPACRWRGRRKLQRAAPTGRELAVT